MKTRLVFVCLLFMWTVAAQQHDQPSPSGVIYGIAIGEDGQPAKGIGLTASPVGVPLATRLPHTRANDSGEYRFEHLPWWGKYRVYAEDDDAGYSLFSTGEGRDDPPEVELTPERREAELQVYLPPKAGFVNIHLTNLRNGAGISGMGVDVMSAESPESPLFTMSCPSNHVVLLPPNKDLLLHVTSVGFREWDESVGKGKPVNVPSGKRLTLTVQLEPSD